ncbi:MAG: hypothetical protein RLY86_205 [Pseudomonadota bacterium]
MPPLPPESHPAVAAADAAQNRRRAERTKTFIRAAIVFPEEDAQPWECVVLDLSPLGCAIYFEESAQLLSPVRLVLPGIEGPVAGRVVADKGDVKHVGFIDKVDAAAVMRVHSAAETGQGVEPGTGSGLGGIGPGAGTTR